jgi:RimJ/RimL family protein N-acetyltransferase
MAEPTMNIADWRCGLPVLTARLVTLREPTPHDLGALVDLLSIGDATRFGIDGELTDLATMRFLERVACERAAGVAFAFLISLPASRSAAGLVRVRQLDLAFEAAEWEITLAPSVRGTGVFLEAARLMGSFAFSVVGVHRLEARVLVQSGRANAALRKLGAVQEGILRRSMRHDGRYFDQVLWSILREDWGDHWVSTTPRVH